MTSTPLGEWKLAKIRYEIKRLNYAKEHKRCALKLSGHVLRAIRDNSHLKRTMLVCDALYAQGFGDIPQRYVRCVLVAMQVSLERGPIAGSAGLDAIEIGQLSVKAINRGMASTPETLEAENGRIVQHSQTRENPAARGQPGRQGSERGKQTGGGQAAQGRYERSFQDV